MELDPEPAPQVAEDIPPLSPEEVAERATKRYETLLAIRSKAINKKGAWYWAHLEPFLVMSESSGLATAVKLRCLLCDAMFSASNPSRTASDHLKRGCCPNFDASNLPSSAMGAMGVASSSALPLRPFSAASIISSAPPLRPCPAAGAPEAAIISSAPPLSRKRPASSSSNPMGVPLLLLPAPQHVALSGGSEDLGALARFEDSVKRLKSPDAHLDPLPLPEDQANAAMALLAEWVLQSCGCLSLVSLNNAKFREFLRRVGLPPVDPRRIIGPVLENKYQAVAADSVTKIRDAPFYQLCSSGWQKQHNLGIEGYKLVNLAANLPSETTVFHRAVLTTASPPSDYAEEVLQKAIIDTSGGAAERCAGIVCDSFSSKALLKMESMHPWMVNLGCQAKAIHGLIKEFARELPLFKTAAANCFKVVTYINKQSQVRRILNKYQLQESNRIQLLRAPADSVDAMANFGPVFSMIEDVMRSIGPLQLVVIDDEFKSICSKEREAVQLAELIQDARFWSDVEAVQAVVRLIKEMTSEMEAERPLVGQCLPLWNDLRSKVHGWCNKFSVDFGPVYKLFQKRFQKYYHPAWSAALILDPLYLIKDASGKYLPPFQLLTPEQEKDVDKLITRLVSSEEAHIALMELMKWRTEGLEPLYAQAVKVKKLDPVTGKMKLAHPKSSRLVWGTCLGELKILGKVAVRLIFLHATASCGLSSNPPVVQWISGRSRSRIAVERVQKMVSIAAHAKLERKDFSNEETEAELLDEEEDVAINEAVTKAPPE